MAIAIVALLAFGGSYAYFTATATPVDSTFITGKLAINQTAQISSVLDESVVPGQNLSFGALSFTYGDSNTIAALRVKITISAAEGNTKKASETFTLGNSTQTDWLISSDTTGDDIVITAYFGKTFDPSATTGNIAPATFGATNITMKNSLNEGYQGLTFDVNIAIDLVQAEYTVQDGTATYENGTELDAQKAAAIFTKVGK